MIPRPTLDHMMSRWRAARDAGQSVTPEELCADSPECLTELRARIAAESSRSHDADDGLSPPTETPTISHADPVAAPPLMVAGRYRGESVHAWGGLGEVLRAEDTELHRTVALKRIIERRADDADSRRRFLREAEITARLQHPGIVPVYGLTHDEHGRPCYAMRFIEGLSLRQAISQLHAANGSAKCKPGDAAPPAAIDYGSLEFRHLVQTLIAVCNTMAYAHSRGILHRDLKPPNIMLGRFGETLVVDWGLACRFDRTESERASGEETLAPSDSVDDSATLTGQAVGTPAFMSPEQAEGDWKRVGPASDVFSLGAILYQVLTGRTPYSGQPPIALDKALRWDFARPRKLAPAVPRALEAICLKAMAKEPSDRYGSAKALADELDRWLADEPISAWQEPFRARLWRWGRRHRTAVLTGAAGLLAIASTLAIGSFLLGRANFQIREEREAARTSFVEAEKRKKEAEQNLEQARLAIQFIGRDILGQANPMKNPIAANITFRQALDGATSRISSAFPNQPEAEAAVREVFGQTYAALGLPAAAADQFQLAIALRQQIQKTDSPQVLDLRHGLANALAAQGKLDDAERHMRIVLDGFTRRLGSTHDRTLTAQGSLAWILKRQRRLPEAERMLREVLAAEIQLQGADHPHTRVTRGSLAGVLSDMGQFAEAETLIRQVLNDDIKFQGPDHPDTLLSMGNLAQVLYVQGKLSEAERWYRDALQGQKRALGPDHSDTITTMRVLGGLLNDREEWDQAVKILSEALPLARKSFPPESPDLSGLLANLGWALVKTNNPSAAEPNLRECVALRKKLLAAGRWEIANSESLLGECLAMQSRFAEAEPMLVGAYDALAAARGCPPVRFRQARDRVVRLYELSGRTDRAAEWRAKPPSP